MQPIYQDRLGVIVEGTTRRQDIIPALADKLAEFIGEIDAPENAYERGLIGRARAQQEKGPRPFEEWCETNACDEAVEMVDELIDAIQCNAPLFTYVGNHPGDGACLGVWPVNVAEAVATGDAIQCEAYRDDTHYAYEAGKAGVEAVFTVTDHGNVSLYVYEDEAMQLAWETV